MAKKLSLEDATDEEIIQEINSRLRIHCEQCGGSGQIVYNALRANATCESCQNCCGTGLRLDAKRALEISYKIGHIY